MDVHIAFDAFLNGMIGRFQWEEIKYNFEIYRCNMDKYLGKKEVVIIAALAENGVIGKGNTIPWRLPDDMKFFAKVTTGHTVIMGRKTWESIPEKFRPLPNRRNIILSKTMTKLIDGAEIFRSIEEAINASTGKIYIIGGAEIYNLAMPYTDKYILTIIDAMVEGDVKFPFNHKELSRISQLVVHPSDDKHKYPFTFGIYVKGTYEINEYFKD